MLKASGLTEQQDKGFKGYKYYTKLQSINGDKNAVESQGPPTFAK